VTAVPAPDLVKYRTFPQTVKRYLSVAPRTAVFQAQVNGAASKDSKSNGIYALNFDNVTLGAYTDISPGMTVDFGTTAGARDIGSARVRKAATSSVLYIGEVAAADVPVADNHYITVRNERQLWQVPPRLVGTQNSQGYTNSYTAYRDYDLTYSSQNKNIGAVVNITGRIAGYVDPGQTYRTVVLDSSLSYAITGSITLRTWAVGDGTITVGDVNSTTITVRFPASSTFRYIALTVVADGVSRTRYYPIFVHDAAHTPITNFDVTRQEWNGAWSMGFELFGQPGQANEAVIPKGALIVYWEEAAFGDDPAPDSYVGEFMGWTLRDTLTLRKYDDRLLLEVGGPGLWLDQWRGFEETLRTKSTPGKWYEMDGVTVDKVLHYILRSFTNYLDLCNFHWAGVTHPDKAIAIPSGTVFRQMTDLAKRYYGSVGFDMHGGLWLRQHFSYLTTDQRAARGNVVSLTTADWKYQPGLTLNRERLRNVGWVKASGSYYTGGKQRVLHARAPGLRDAYGSNREEAPFQHLPVSNALTELLRLTGHHWARLNNPVPSARYEMVGNFACIEPAWNEPVALSYSHNSLTDDTITSEQYIVTAMNIRHSNQRGEAPKTITVTVEKVTSGEKAEQYKPTAPKNRPFTVPDVSLTVPQINFPPIFAGDPIITPTGSNNVALLMSSRRLHRTSGFFDSPTYDQVTFSTRNNAGPRDSVVDPKNPVGGWFITQYSIYYIQDAFADVPVLTEQFVIPTTYSWVSSSLDFSFGAGGAGLYGVATWSDDGRPVYSAVTTDGVNWTELASPISANNTAFGSGAVFIDSRTGSAYASAPISSNRYPLFKLALGASAWTQVGNTTNLVDNSSFGSNMGCIVIPYADTDGNTVFYEGNFELRRGSLSASGTETDITPVAQAVPSVRNAMSFAPGNKNIMAVVGNTPSPNLRSGIWITSNAYATTPTYTEIRALEFGSLWRRCALRDEFDVFFWGDDTLVGYWDGSSLSIKSGNIPANSDNVIGMFFR
jgi:hypothetical protein